MRVEGLEFRVRETHRISAGLGVVRHPLSDRIQEEAGSRAVWIEGGVVGFKGLYGFCVCFFGGFRVLMSFWVLWLMRLPLRVCSGCVVTTVLAE